MIMVINNYFMAKKPQKTCHVEQIIFLAFYKNLLWPISNKDFFEKVFSNKYIEIIIIDLAVVINKGVSHEKPN